MRGWCRFHAKKHRTVEKTVAFFEDSRRWKRLFNRTLHFSCLAVDFFKRNQLSFVSFVSFVVKDKSAYPAWFVSFVSFVVRDKSALSVVIRRWRVIRFIRCFVCSCYPLLFTCPFSVSRPLQIGNGRGGAGENTVPFGLGAAAPMIGSGRCQSWQRSGTMMAAAAANPFLSCGVFWWSKIEWRALSDWSFYSVALSAGRSDLRLLSGNAHSRAKLAYP